MDLDPFISVHWTTLNPDMAGVVSTDPSAGAALIMFDTSWAMPAVTSDFRLQVTSNQTGTIVFHGIVQGTPGQTPTSTWASLALDLANQINNHPVLKAHNVAAQLSNPGISTLFGITHFNDNPLTVTPLTGEPILQVQNGSMAWDAGPLFFLKRVPPGRVPPPGTNCGQIMYTSVDSNFADVQYVTLGATVDSSDAKNLAGSFHLYTASTINGAPLLRERLVINEAGMFFDGKQVVTK